MLTQKFWRDTLERAVSTAAEAAILILGADQVNAISADWQMVAGFAGGGAVLAILKSLAAARTVGSMDSASLDPNV